jgi:hypothetical protein
MGNEIIVCLEEKIRLLYGGIVICVSVLLRTKKCCALYLGVIIQMRLLIVTTL